MGRHNMTKSIIIRSLQHSTQIPDFRELLEQEDPKQLSKTIEAGQFFGEVALVQHNTARSADCIAKGRVKVKTD